MYKNLLRRVSVALSLSLSLSIFSPTLTLSDDGMRIVRSHESGRVTGIFMDRSATGKKVSSVDPVLISDAFIEKVSSEGFSIKDVTRELAVANVKESETGVTHVRYVQEYQGVPVYKGGLVAHIAGGEVLSVTGNLLPDIDVDIDNAISERTAIKIAKLYIRRMAPYNDMRRTLRKKYRRKCRRKGVCNSAKLRKKLGVLRFKRVLRVEQFIYNKDFTNDGGDSRSKLIYKVRLRDSLTSSDNKILYINAHTGAIEDIEGSKRHLSSRKAKDCSLGVCYLDQFFSSYNYIFGRSEGKPSRGPNPLAAPFSGSTDVDDAYDLIPVIEQYYIDTLNRNGGNSRGGMGDGSGSAPYTQSIVNVHADGVDPTACPYGAWFGFTSIYFCARSMTLDAFAHEYAHFIGYYHSFNPDNSFNELAYSGEVASLEEANSDVFGEIFEYRITGSTDWVAYKGTDTDEILRSMINPASAIDKAPFPLQYPADYTSSDVYCGTENFGGAWHNSTVPSHAAYLAVEGGEHNGCTIQGIGIDKVEQIWYKAIVDYFDLNETFNMAYESYQGACNELAGAGMYGITAADCQEVKKALEAVKMDKAGACSPEPYEGPATCAVVQDPPPPGDFDTDEDVDAMDYVVWHDTVGQTGAGLAADANEDLVVDSTDCEIWKSNYGACVNGGCAQLDMLQGDYDNDRDVDSDDYLVWKSNYGLSGIGGELAGDGNEDGTVDASDYAIWRENLGMGNCSTLSPALNADLDTDGDIDNGDFDVLVAFYGATGAGVVGDLNGDEIVDINDCNLLYESYSIGLCPPAGFEGEPCEGTFQQLVPGDGNYDGANNLADYTVWRNNYGSTLGGASYGDYNKDGRADAADYTVWRDNFGAGTCPDIPVASLAVPGDFNGDGSVDGRDFLEWQRSIGINPGSGADANGDGIVDGDDMAYWSDNYGQF